MRALPHDFVRNLSDNELSRKMKIKVQWGKSWESEISKNPRFYFMEKSGWDKFVRDCGLGGNEFLVFTHKGKLRFGVNIYIQDGKEMLQPAVASSSRVKTEQDVETEPETTTRARKHKRKLSFENSQSDKPALVWRNFAVGASSTSIREFNIVIQKAYLTNAYAGVPEYVAKHYMPKKNTKFVIHHSEDKDKAWELVYVAQSSKFCDGWKRLVEEYPLTLNDICKFTFIKPDELILHVSNLQNSTVPEFTIFIHNSYLNFVVIPSNFAKNHLPNENATIKIHRPDKEKTWEVTYLVREKNRVLSGGWKLVTTEYPISIGDMCKFTLVKPNEFFLQVSKPWP